MRSALRLLALMAVAGLVVGVASAQAVTTTSTFTLRRRSPRRRPERERGAGDLQLEARRAGTPAGRPTTRRSSPTLSMAACPPGVVGRPHLLGPASSSSDERPLPGDHHRLPGGRVRASSQASTCPVAADHPHRRDAAERDGAGERRRRCHEQPQRDPEPRRERPAHQRHPRARSSGVTQAAVTDVDGDGTFPCSIFFNDPNPDFSGCAGNFNPATPATLTAGDGVKTVGVKFGRDGDAHTPRALHEHLLRGDPREPDPRQRVGHRDRHHPARHRQADRPVHPGPLHGRPTAAR